MDPHTHAHHSYVYTLACVSFTSTCSVSTRSLLSLSGGLAVGLTAIASGVAIGVVADSGIRAVAQQSKLFCPMVLTLIFCEALGELYRLMR